jgi:DNA mismatch repair protein MutL
MQDIIKLLPDAIANQIAAGEVVQRPASAVKELLENAIDAGASHIQLIVRDAGKNLIQVIDNGKGMSETDARMSFERHATSKIRTAADLFSLRTMGFRGEALASIAAVAQVELRSRRPTDELGILIKIEGSDLKIHEPTQCAVGTSIQVKNLFYNIPARRNFLKSNPVEMKHIIDEFQRVALAQPQIAFSMYVGDDEMYQLPAAKIARRIIDLLGKNFEQQMATCQEETELLKVYGYVGKPAFAKKTKTEQFFFVNGRFIKSGYLHHAVMTAYAGMLEVGAHPFYTLFLEIDPQHIDINVHPTKTEIKFDDERSIYAVLSAAARKAISQYNLAPSMNFDSQLNHELLPFAKRQEVQPTSHKAYEKTSLNPLPKANLGSWEKLYEGIDKKNISYTPEQAQSQQLPIEQAAIAPLDATTNSTTATGLMQLHRQYILAQVRSGLMLVHLPAAYERVYYERYTKASQTQKQLPSQTLLFPESISFNAADYVLIMELEPEAKLLGFDYTPVGGHTIMLHALPPDLATEPAPQLMEELLEQYKNQKNELKLNHSQLLARAMARRIAARQLITLSPDQMQGLIDQLFACQNPQLSPSGKPILKLLSLQELHELL